MVKIVIIVTMLALACVSAQLDVFNPGAMMDDIWNHPMFQKMNIRVPNPREFINNMKPGPYQDFHSSFMSQTSENGKVITIIESNDNGKKKKVVVTN